MRNQALTTRGSLLSLVMTLALSTLAAIAIPAGASAQTQTEGKKEHHHYKLVDVGTFGGTTSYVNFFTDVLNNRGTVVGSSQIALPQPPTTNGFPCPPGNVYKVFEWNDGMVTNLGALSDGNCSNANWINANGEIAGIAENGALDPVMGVNEIRAVVWKHGKIKDLGTLGGNQSGAQAINNRGDVAGFALNETPDAYSLFDLLILNSSNGTQTRAVVWRNGKVEDLQTLGGPDAIAWFENERGQVAGFSYTNSIPNDVTGIPTVHPFLWDHGVMKDLGSFGGFGNPFFGFLTVNGLNNRGGVIGASPLPGDQSSDPFLWDGKRLIDMAVEGKGGQFFDANVINDAGEIAGGAVFSTRPNDAALWKDGVVTDLGTVGTDCYSEAWSISSSGQVGGTSVSCDGNTWRAFLWDNGSMVDLRSLVSSGPDLQLVYTIGINDRGEIAGNGVPAGTSTTPPFQDTLAHAFVMIPCDDNHADVEGCDYSLVETPGEDQTLSSHSTTVLASPANATQLSPAEIRTQMRSRMQQQLLRMGALPRGSK